MQSVLLGVLPVTHCFTTRRHIRCIARVCSTHGWHDFEQMQEIKIRDVVAILVAHSAIALIAGVDGGDNQAIAIGMNGKTVTVPQLGVDVSTTSGHSLSDEAPWYMPRRDLLVCPHGFYTCIRNNQTSSFVQSSIGE